MAGPRLPQILETVLCRQEGQRSRDLANLMGAKGHTVVPARESPHEPEVEATGPKRCMRFGGPPIRSCDPTSVHQAQPGCGPLYRETINMIRVW